MRPTYQDDAVTLKLDTTSSFTAAGLTATNFVWCGASNWTLHLASGLTAANDITIQTNSSNLISTAASKSTSAVYNSSFSANWIDLAVLSAGYNMISITNIPCRYIRLSGIALTGGTCYAYLWTGT